ncbi:hypothetical protein CF336_g6299 [Tilletia laevis]|nr:hypothetical protein CF336_g6299 [Tilletia laevis]
MSPIHVFDRTEDDFTCYTVEVAAAAATGSSWAPVAACMDTILFPHPVSDKEHWDDDVALAMAGLGLEQAFRTGARIFVLTAGTNRERALLTKRDETATSIDTSGLLKVRSMLISINGHACLFFFVVIRHSAPHFSAATHFDNFDTLADITDVFESMVWALYALWARDQEIRNRPLPPIIASRLREYGASGPNLMQTPPTTSTSKKRKYTKRLGSGTGSVKKPRKPDEGHDVPGQVGDAPGPSRTAA